MALLVELPPDVEKVLTSEAKRRGVTPESLAADDLKALYRMDGPAPARGSDVPTAQSLSPTAALFASWAAQDAADDPEETARRQQEGDALLVALDDNPLALRRVDLSDWPDEAAA